jgi:hypothetical protein
MATQTETKMKLTLATVILAASTAMASAQTFPGAETVGFAKECFVPIMSEKTAGKVLYWNIAVSCAADRARTSLAAERQEAIEREEARAAIAAYN